MTVEHRFGQQYTLIDALAISDTDLHTPDSDSEISILDMHRFGGTTIRIVNTLNEAVDIKFYGNMTEDETSADQIGATVTVAATTGIETRTIVPENDGWMPFVYVTAQCSVAPASGDVTVEAVLFDPFPGA